jgi:hypothetical protein
MEALSRPMPILVGQPWLAELPGAVLLGLWAASRCRLVLVAAIAWLLSVPYEYGMKWRVLCSGECNIRVDLLVLAWLACSARRGASAASVLRGHAQPGEKSFPLSSTT